MSPSAVVNIPRLGTAPTSIEKAIDDVSATRSQTAIMAAIELIYIEPEHVRLVWAAKLADAAVISIEMAEKLIKARIKAEKEELDTHGKVVRKYEARLHTSLVGYAGQLWEFNESTGLFEGGEIDKHFMTIAELYKLSAVCRRKNDYSSILSLLYMEKEDPEWTEGRPPGVALADGFYSVMNDEIVCEPLREEHRATFKIDVVPSYERPEQFLALLNNAFGGRTENNEKRDPSGQIRMMRQALGMTLFQMMSKQQHVAFLYGKAATGKSVILKIIEKCFPSEVVSAVSPLKFDDDYSVADLAGKVVNLVPEVDRDKAIPSGAFKTITGLDTLNGRKPFAPPMKVRPRAAHWFNSNYFLTTKDQTDGFWRRWMIFVFENTIPEGKRIPNLDQVIVDSELDRIIGWAIGGVRDYLRDGLFISEESKEAVESWKGDSDSVRGWLRSLTEAMTEELQKKKMVDAHDKYRDWCLFNARKSVGLQEFKGRINTPNSGWKTYKAGGYELIKLFVPGRPWE